MAKFCSNCGTGLDDTAKFCLNCGTPVAQPPAQPEQPPVQPEAPPPTPEAVQPEPAPVPPQPAAPIPVQPQPYAQYPQQPYPQPQQPYMQPQPYPQPYPEAPLPAPKKKSKLPLVLAIVAVVVLGGIAAIVAGIVGAVNKTANADYYVLGSDQIPSVKLALGEKRKITSASTSISNGVAMKEYQYSAPDVDQALEMSQYLTHLRGQGFLLLTDVDFSAPEAWCKVGRNSEDSGYQVVVQIEYDNKGYTVIVVKEEGSIQANTNNTEDPTTPAEDPTQPYERPTRRSEAPPADEWLGLWRGSDDEGVELILLDDDGSFLVSFYYWDEGGEDFDLMGMYRLEEGTLLLYDVIHVQLEEYRNDISIDCRIDGDAMFLGEDESEYTRIPERDRRRVYNNPFIVLN